MVDSGHAPFHRLQFLKIIVKNWAAPKIGSLVQLTTYKMSKDSPLRNTVKSSVSYEKKD